MSSSRSGRALAARPVFLATMRGDAGEQVALRLLAAEAAAHAADLDRDRVRGHVQHLGHHVLDLARVLGRGVDRDLVVLARHRQRDLALEIEMLLPADAHPAGRAGAGRPRSPPWRRRAAASADRSPARRSAAAASASRIAGSSSYSTIGQRSRAARLLAGVRGDRENRLAHELDEIGRQQRLVVAVGRADVVLARHVGSREHADHAGSGPHRRRGRR